MAPPQDHAIAPFPGPQGQLCMDLVPMLGLAVERDIFVAGGFGHFAGFLSEMVSLSPSEARARYPDPLLYEFGGEVPSQLLAACMQHSERHASGLEDAPTLLLVHPLAPYLRRWDARHDVRPYGSADAAGVQRVLDTLADAKAEGFSTALIEDPVSYALASARLVETGKIDDVFFSKHRWGEALDPSGYGRLPARPAALAGAYTQTCVRAALGEICKTRASEIALLEEMCVTWPYERGNPRAEAFMCASAHGRRVRPIPAGRAADYLREIGSAARARA